MHVISKQIEIDGVETNYLEYGEGSIVLFFLHGWGQSMHSFENILPYFDSRKYKIYIPNLPGFGSTQYVPGNWGVLDYSAYIYKFIQSLKLKRPNIIGHSFGGRILYNYITNNENWNKAFIYSTSYRKKNTILSETIYYFSSIIGFVLPQLVVWGHSTFLRPRSYNNNVNLNYKKCRNAVSIFRRVKMESTTYSEKSDIPKKTVDVIFIFGGKDKIIETMSYDLFKKRLPEAKFIKEDNAGHFFHIQNPELFVQMITRNI